MNIKKRNNCSAIKMEGKHECNVCYKQQTSNLSICGDSKHNLCFVCLQTIVQKDPQCPVCRKFANDMVVKSEDDQSIDTRKLLIQSGNKYIYLGYMTNQEIRKKSQINLETRQEFTEAMNGIAILETRWYKHKNASGFKINKEFYLDQIKQQLLLFIAEKFDSYRDFCKAFMRNPLNGKIETKHRFQGKVKTGKHVLLYTIDDHDKYNYNDELDSYKILFNIVLMRNETIENKSKEDMIYLYNSLQQCPINGSSLRLNHIKQLDI